MRLRRLASIRRLALPPPARAASSDGPGARGQASGNDANFRLKHCVPAGKPQETWRRDIRAHLAACRGHRNAPVDAGPIRPCGLIVTGATWIDTSAVSVAGRRLGLAGRPHPRNRRPRRRLPGHQEGPPRGHATKSSASRQRRCRGLLATNPGPQVLYRVEVSTLVEAVDHRGRCRITRGGVPQPRRERHLTASRGSPRAAAAAPVRSLRTEARTSRRRPSDGTR